MTRPPPTFWVDLAERVGVPTMLLAALLYGTFLLLQPVVIAAANHFEQQTEQAEKQTELLGEMSLDLKMTREIVQADKEERKAEMLRDINRKMDLILNNGNRIQN